eukprot:TRINITY_DN4514_c0_g1_i1.p1 TRINITY_DN4514_c0_g1~~TRINITY_DN4514_c0_g1_i1.p1  ORF type:complete len:789 (+),score=276.78 TRINITY_DN4514_c0_g1_i1:301-2367(+)
MRWAAAASGGGAAAEHAALEAEQRGASLLAAARVAAERVDALAVERGHAAAAAATAAAAASERQLRWGAWRRLLCVALTGQIRQARAEAALSATALQLAQETAPATAAAELEEATTRADSQCSMLAELLQLLSDADAARSALAADEGWLARAESSAALDAVRWEEREGRQGVLETYYWELHRVQQMQRSDGVQALETERRAASLLAAARVAAERVDTLAVERGQATAAAATAAAAASERQLRWGAWRRLLCAAFTSQLRQARAEVAVSGTAISDRVDATRRDADALHAAACVATAQASSMADRHARLREAAAAVAGAASDRALLRATWGRLERAVRRRETPAPSVLVRGMEALEAAASRQTTLRAYSRLFTFAVVSSRDRAISDTLSKDSTARSAILAWTFRSNLPQTSSDLHQPSDLTRIQSELEQEIGSAGSPLMSPLQYAGKGVRRRDRASLQAEILELKDRRQRETESLLTRLEGMQQVAESAAVAIAAAERRPEIDSATLERLLISREASASKPPPRRRSAPPQLGVASVLAYVDRLQGVCADAAAAIGHCDEVNARVAAACAEALVGRNEAALRTSRFFALWVHRDRKVAKRRFSLLKRPPPLLQSSSLRLATVAEHFNRSRSRHRIWSKLMRFLNWRLHEEVQLRRQQDEVLRAESKLLRQQNALLWAQGARPDSRPFSDS